MESNLKRILQEFENLKGQLVINGTEVMRYIAVGTDEEDYYYVLYDGRKVIWSTCVGKLISLKGKIDESDYNTLVRLAKLNHSDQFEDDNRRNAMISILGSNDKYLTPIHWEIV